MATKFTKHFVSIDREELLKRLRDMDFGLYYLSTPEPLKVEKERVPKYITFELESSPPNI